MRPTLIRILKHGLPAAVFLAVLGYLYAEVAGIWVVTHGAPRMTEVDTTAGGAGPALPASEAVAANLRVRLPLTMAAWGFGLVAVFELMLRLWRGNPPPPPVNRPPVPTEDEVEQLLNQLLQQAEAAEAARKGGVAPGDPTPPPSGGLPCPAPPAADNSPAPAADRPG